MITYKEGNLLEANAQALVNTVNTEGVMGKGIALMFKERFADNFKRYAAACKAKQVRTGKMFVTEVNELDGPRWIVNFPTKQHWRPPSKLEWVTEGLQDLRRFLIDNQVESIAIPPLGAGNGGLPWQDVRKEIEIALGDITNTEIIVFEPTAKYQNVAKRSGVEKLTPARALIAELVRRYWVLGMECSLLEIQKLAWFLERTLVLLRLENPLDLRFQADKYGPYANRLSHLLNNLDGSYLHCEKRISDASPLDVIWFEDKRTDFLQAYLKSAEMRPYVGALEQTAALIDGFESPYGMELLATVDWLINTESSEAAVPGIQRGLSNWPASKEAADRKMKLFDERAIDVALNRLVSHGYLAKH
jgi:O-acetyl-ADP-ribose deacetylase (regulator of RNase III)